MRDQPLSLSNGCFARAGPGSMDIYHQLNSDLQRLVRFHLDNAQDFTYSFK